MQNTGDRTKDVDRTQARTRRERPMTYAGMRHDIPQLIMSLTLTL